MANTPGSDASHDSHDEGNNGASSKAHAVKDRECQYCHQKFTSSSLGRHLDQFLHKKKPDGIHSVEEIRRLRGGITRRLARHSSRHDHEDSHTSNASPAPQASPPVIDTLNQRPRSGVEFKFNTLNWHSTGVINDLPSSTRPYIASPMPITESPTSVKRSFSAFASTDPLNTEKEIQIRALELSLREVLSSVSAATSRATPRMSPFTFDIQSQTFPSLCLTLLPLPPTIFSPSPFSTSTSAPLSPPDASHLPLLRLSLETKIQTWKWDSLRAAQSLTYPTAHANNLGEEADYLAHTAAQYDEFSRKHLETALGAWNALSPTQQAEMWQVELFRAFATQKRKTSELEEKLEKMTQDVKSLQNQLETLSRCQWPREMALWPPERVQFSKVATEEMRGMNLDVPDGTDGGRAGDDAAAARDVAEKWDYERLVEKWKKRVREDRTRRTGMAATGLQALSPLPAVTGAARANTPRMAELQRGSETPEGDGTAVGKRLRLDTVNGGGSGSRNTNTSVGNMNVNGGGGDPRRKSIRQQQQQGSGISMEDQDGSFKDLNNVVERGGR